MSEKIPLSIDEEIRQQLKRLSKELQYEMVYGPDWKSFLNPITYKSKGFQKWNRHQVYCKGVKIGTIYE